ncbi:PREDICTED: uncharacterized protein LOC108449080 [Corvus brachyrhynchos]|uniref:uncharacterized protein LOC108449080 n=1 Tax=Corvus brachyrhynchos TaxID=85066 RepID=UPI00081664F7|nr:PREDICTED: uncharacterized protein LOC108449080 [Corvus brachyrhynchos]
MNKGQNSSPCRVGILTQHIWDGFKLLGRDTKTRRVFPESLRSALSPLWGTSCQRESRSEGGSWFWGVTASLGVLQWGLRYYSLFWCVAAGFGVLQLVFGVLQLVLGYYSCIWCVAAGSGVLQLVLGYYSWFWGVAAGLGVLQLILVCCSWFWGIAAGFGVLQLVLGCCSWFWGITAVFWSVAAGLGYYSCTWCVAAVFGILQLYLGCYSCIWGVTAVFGVLQLFFGVSPSQHHPAAPSPLLPPSLLSLPQLLSRCCSRLSPASPVPCPRVPAGPLCRRPVALCMCLFCFSPLVGVFSPRRIVPAVLVLTRLLFSCL